MKNLEIEEKFRKVHLIIEEIKENYHCDLDNISEFCEKYELDGDEIENFGFDLIINRMVITKLENKIKEIYDEFQDREDKSEEINDDELEDKPEEINDIITDDDIIEEAKNGRPQLVATVGDLKKLINEFPDNYILTGNTTDGKNWNVYPVFVFKSQGDNNMLCIYLNEYKNSIDHDSTDEN